MEEEAWRGRRLRSGERGTNRDVDDEADADADAGNGWAKDRFARFRRIDVGAIRLILYIRSKYVQDSEQIDIYLVVIVVDSVFTVVAIDPVNVRCV